MAFGAVDLAFDGTGDAAACRDHRHPLNGVGQESAGAADVLQDGHQVRWRDRLEARPSPSPRPPVLGGPTPVSESPRRPYRVCHR